MQQFSAYMFFWCGRVLKDIKTDCHIASIPVPGDTPIFNFAARLDERAREKATRTLGFAEPEFRKTGLTMAAEMTKDLIKALEKPASNQNYQWLVDQISMIERLADKELGSKFFLYIPPELARFWPSMDDPDIFGDEVAAKFPSATVDIRSSGICIATMMSTAAVFHLMRVLEIGLSALGKVFRVSLAHTNWAPAIEKIESEIRNMHKDPVWRSSPDCKDQQRFYAQAASHFAILKDAWRNHTMHARGEYTQEEAESIFGHVKGFMQKLAEAISE